MLGEMEITSRVALTVLWYVFRSHKSAWFPMLTARRFSEFNVICHAVLTLCLGSFLLVARYYVLRPTGMALKRRRLKYSMKIMHTLIPYWLIL